MALPSSGLITAAMINQELGRSASAPFSLNDSAVRALAGKPSGLIRFSDFHGKSSIIREPASGEYYTANVSCFAHIGHPGYEGNQGSIEWFDNVIATQIPNSTTSFTKDGWTYHRGTHREVRPYPTNPQIPVSYYAIYRTK